MATDPLQIALEHHRAARLRQAEAAYLAILATDPGNPQAMHWLGVLMLQAGHAKEAVVLLEQAAAICPRDIAFAHNLAQAYLRSGQTDQAIATFDKALELEPHNADCLMGLGWAFLKRSKEGDPNAAITAFVQANAAGVDTYELYRCLGTALMGNRQGGAAVAAFKTAIEKEPNEPLAHYQLAAAHHMEKDLREVRKELIKALEIDPAFARGWQALGMVEWEQGKYALAIGLFKKAIDKDANCTAAYQGLGHCLEKLNRRQEALDAFRQAVRTLRAEKVTSIGVGPVSLSVAALERRLIGDSKNRDLHYTLAMAGNIFSPPLIPAWALVDLFDRYAETFDDSLVNKLKYHAPELIAQSLARHNFNRSVDILDLGCGTGLCGPLLRPMARNLVGIDLSSGMIEKARLRNVYDHLEQAELVEMMNKSPSAYDLLVAADVLIYIGDLAPTFEAARVALRPGGRLVFTVEAGDHERFQLVQKTGRYTHSRSYLTHLGSIYGFAEEALSDIIARQNAGQPVQGFLVEMRLPE